MADGINTVIFDMDGVIFDSEILVLSSWKEVAGRHGIQDVEKLLKYLKDKGFKVGIASSTREKIVRRQIWEGGLLEYFDQIVGGDMVKHSKPEPDIFLEACGRLESKPENCYVIEDSYNGIRAAHAAGMHPIMVPNLMEPTEEMKSLAEQILGSLCAVQEFLQESVR